MGRNFKDSIPVFLALLLFLSICFGLPILYPNGLDVGVEAVDVTISPGMSAREVANKIAAAGVVDTADGLIRWMVRFGIDRTLRPGLYKLNRGNAVDVALQIKRAVPIVENIVLIPGMRFWRAAEVIYGEEGNAVDKMIDDMTKDEIFPEEIRDKLPAEAKHRIAFLLPETYHTVPETDRGAQVIKRAADLWWERIGKTLPPDISAEQLTMLATLASIVEGEAKVAEERPILAGIFMNRIDKQMRLQSCATVIYSWELRGVKKSSLTYSDLEIESQYNTYTNNGLPPGPIAMPSVDSWRSAVNPEETPYLFFFATPQGEHIFSRTYQEHLQQQREAAAQ